MAAGIVASSVALVGFGVDSFVETTSGAVVRWRLRAELVGQLDKEHAEHLERRAGRVAGALLFGLSVYIVVDAGRRLLGFGPEAQESQGYAASDGSSKMPSFNDSMTVQEVVDLVAYLRSLKPPAGGGHGA